MQRDRTKQSVHVSLRVCVCVYQCVYVLSSMHGSAKLTNMRIVNLIPEKRY